jgi:hypothetical protein
LFDAKKVAVVATTTQPFIVENGPIARFVFDKTEIDKDGLPKRKAFKPELFEQRHELSICGMNNVAVERMWHLGKTVREGKSAYASISLTTTLVSQVGLRTIAAPAVPDFGEHGVVLGWSDDKDARMLMQADLAAKCSKSDVHYPPAAA